MNRQKLARRTAHAQTLRDRHNPPYRVVTLYAGEVIASARTRDEARTIKRQYDLRGDVSMRIERRVDNGMGGVSYVRQ